MVMVTALGSVAACPWLLSPLCSIAISAGCSATWGKLGRYPPWPGKIVNPPKDLKKPRGKKCFFVKFFGTEDHAWIKVEQLKPYHPHKEEMIKINKGKRFQQAVDAVEEFLRKTKGKDQASSHNSTEEKNRRNSSEERGKQSAGEEKRKASLSEGKVKKGTGEGKKRVSSVSSERGSKSPLKRAQDQSPRKRGRPPKDEKDLTIPESSTVKRVMTGTVAGFKWPPSVSEPVKDSDPHFHHFLLSQTEKPAVCYQAITKKLKVCEEETGSTSIQAADSTAVNGSITPTDKKIGFLGLGLMGSGIVSNLLKMGHTVTVWNRTAEKCDLFIQEGARLGRTPAEVVSTCDITFACVSDPKAAKDLVLGPSGVLQGIRPGKCYVDMSTVDADTVTELAQVIVSRGGRFLEAPVSGNQQLSNDGMLVILAAGDRGLYEDCSSCFQAMGKTSFFLGEVGNAAKMMLIVNMVQGSFMATIAEGLTLAQVTGQSQQTLLDILNQGQLASIFLDQKCQNILQGNFKPDFYLKYIQKDLRLAIALGDSVNHPTPMAAAANEEEEFKWLLQEEVHAVLRQLQDILKEASHRFALPTSGSGGAVKQENFVLSTSGTDQVKGVMTLQGDALCQADVNLKMPRNNQLLHFAFREDKQWKLQQIQDARNHVNQAIYLLMNRDVNYQFKTGLEVLKLSRARNRLTTPATLTLPEIASSGLTKMFTPVLPPDILVNFYINLNKLCLTVYQLHVMQPSTTKNFKPAGGSVLHNPGAMFEFGSQRYEVSHVHKVECVVPWLNDALVFFTVSLQLCQQLKDKISVFSSYWNYRPY
ncbi:putative oxidoreductase GLYR1 isoform X3 [Onychostruthus taczanowskii]|uniref:putative oxidoreductase GLYR1 isoform X3 n=1 Tax=Onychostruthus taczanowskii TaxID=356909 RepID=UPI001B802614|nr:putative oxidoreductase GLYR1 isoform X3 [Onychostruthus taczanowskii]